MEHIEFRILGPLEILVGGAPIRVGGPKERALLTLLALDTGEILSPDRLIEGLWGEAPPASAMKTLQTYVAHLRRALEQGAPGARPRILTRARGYLLDAPSEDIDAGRFERLVAEGRLALGERRYQAASNVLRQALSLWRGSALADLDADGAAQAEIARLDEERLRALEARIDADLGCGAHADVVPELQRLVAVHPLRETLRAQLMLALYRSGRQAEALDAYQRARALLVQELGIEPGPTLRRLEEQILRQDSALDRNAEPADVHSTPGAEELLQTAHVALARYDWRGAHDALTRADATRPLDPEHLERLAEAAWWGGRGEDCIAARERAYAGYFEQGDVSGSARAAIGLAEDHFHMGAFAVCRGWIGRAERLLQGVGQTVEYGHLLRVKTTIAFDLDGNTDLALDLAAETLAIGLAVGERDLQVIALQDKGRILVNLGSLAEGMSLIDEAMAATVGDELGPYATGVAYCNTIITCESLADYNRAGEWTEAMLRWCERHARSGFPGVCRVFQAEILRLRGRWRDAEETARRAAAELEHVVPFYAGEAWYEVGETRRRIGDLAAAEEAFRRAHALGREPSPGLALLRLAQGDVDAAFSLIRETVQQQAEHSLNRMRNLPAQVEIALAAGDLGVAHSSLDEMLETSARFGSSVMAAACAQAEGAIRLVEAAPLEAAERVREAVRLWRKAELPYEVACAQLLLARSYRDAGDRERATLEENAARASYDALGAAADLR
ncbi:MAG: hypothetical protein CVU47_04580 [Chloroflexi bacterium HGW-Chloroflexi-9]|nr:MAG: hypothetical protein CVU47_04580 [Chloroflexi bacterium HGW-Chloroflexi-9]